MVILVCRVSVLDLVNKMRGERVDCLCFREKSTILSSLLSRAAESDQPASNQTVISGSETAGQAGQAGLANSNLSSQVRAKKSAGVGSDPLPCGLQCKRIKQVRLQTCLCSGSALTFINPSQWGARQTGRVVMILTQMKYCPPGLPGPGPDTTRDSG